MPWQVNAGDYDCLIELQSKAESQDAAGQPSEVWTTIPRGQVWAKRRMAAAGRLSERFLENQVVAKQVMQYEIRYSADVDGLNPKSHRIMDGARAYDILSIEPLGRNVALRIIAEARAE